jgi:hypothetical protein
MECDTIHAFTHSLLPIVREHTLSEETVNESTSKSMREHIQAALIQDQKQQGESAQKKVEVSGEAFLPGDDQFLRVAYYLSQVTEIKDYQALYDQAYKLSFAKINVDYTQTYSLDQYANDAQALNGYVIPWQANQLGNSKSGYPLSPGGTGYGATHRIYLNPDPRYAIAVYKYFLEQAKNAAWGKAVLSSKLGDYQVVTTCRDVTVIYMSGQDMLGIFSATLRQYQQDHANHFLDEIPVMTAPLPGLQGVGYAEDLAPLLDGGQVLTYWQQQDETWRDTHPWIGAQDGLFGLSHSQWRSVFILAALRMPGQSGMDGLRANLTKIAAVAGLTPATMYKKPAISKELVAMIADVLFPAG